jgi:pimeloyl-ACP methyl ester carboxylesterase
MGEEIAARFAEEFPDRVSAPVLVDAGGMQISQGDRIPLVFRLARIPVVSLVMLRITPRSLAVEGLNDAIVRKQIIDSAMIDSYWDFAHGRRPCGED